MCRGEDGIAFDARFQNNSFRVQLPVNAIVAVQTKDKAVGFSFEDNDTATFSFDLDKHEIARSRFQVVDWTFNPPEGLYTLVESLTSHVT